MGSRLLLWIENSGLGGDQSSTFGFEEAWVYGILTCQDIFLGY